MGVGYCSPDGQLPQELKKLNPGLLDRVMSVVLKDSTGVSWDAIAGQQDAKRLIQETMVYPMLNPALYKVQPLHCKVETLYCFLTGAL